MQNLEYRQVKKFIATEYICNMCGKSISAEIDKKYNPERNLFHDFQIDFQYGSKHDNESWKFDLCEKCLLKIIQLFDIEPEKIYQSLTKL